MDPDYVLGTDENQEKIMAVLKDSEHKFVFYKAREQLGVQERYDKRDEEKKRFEIAQ
jgi:hypothetical protein